MDGKTGAIMVLLPGGQFYMGASKKKNLHNYDPSAKGVAWPHEVLLDPFFMGKHEMTRGQWTRIAGARDPSYWVARNFADVIKSQDYPRLPVDSVSWFACEKELGRCGLVLPTEARWEYACRAGTETAWNWGRRWSLFAKYANLGDKSYKDKFGSGHDYMMRKDDGYSVPAPVGSFLPNKFVLYDMHGNLSEWCFDRFGPYSGGHRAGDGMLLQSTGNEKRIYRGGCIDNTIYESRSHSRGLMGPKYSGTIRGCRPARPLRR